MVLAEERLDDCGSFLMLGQLGMIPPSIQGIGKERAELCSGLEVIDVRVQVTNTCRGKKRVRVGNSGELNIAKIFLR